jgi:hypothetical protein
MQTRDCLFRVRYFFTKHPPSGVFSTGIFYPKRQTKHCLSNVIQLDQPKISPLAREQNMWFSPRARSSEGGNRERDREWWGHHYQLLRSRCGGSRYNPWISLQPSLLSALASLCTPPSRYPHHAPFLLSLLCILASVVCGLDFDGCLVKCYSSWQILVQLVLSEFGVNFLKHSCSVNDWGAFLCWYRQILLGRKRHDSCSSYTSTHVTFITMPFWVIVALPERL